MTVKAKVIKKNNMYYVDIIYKDPVSGERTRTTRGTGLKATKFNLIKAGFKAVEFEEEYQRISDQKPETILFTDYMIKWLDYIKNHVKKNTYRTYEMYTVNHIVPYFKDKKLMLKDLKALHIERFLTDKHNNGLSARTIKHIKGIISNAMNEARREELIIVNPVELVRRTPKVEKNTVNALTPEQSKMLLNGFRNTQLFIPVMLGLYFGLRRSEIIGLTWNNIDFENNKIIISQTVTQEVGGDEFSKSTKTDSSRRALPIPDFVYNELKAEKSRKPDSVFVCTYDNGERMKANYLTKNYRAIADKLGFTDFTFHDLRHTNASNLLEAGHTVVEVQHWLGHSSPKTTLDIYSHITSNSAFKRMSGTVNGLFTEKSLTDPETPENVISIFSFKNGVNSGVNLKSCQNSEHKKRTLDKPYDKQYQAF